MNKTEPLVLLDDNDLELASGGANGSDSDGQSESGKGGHGGSQDSDGGDRTQGYTKNDGSRQVKHGTNTILGKKGKKGR